MQWRKSTFYWAPVRVGPPPGQHCTRTMSLLLCCYWSVLTNKLIDWLIDWLIDCLICMLLFPLNDMLLICDVLVKPLQARASITTSCLENTMKTEMFSTAFQSEMCSSQITSILLRTKRWFTDRIGLSYWRYFKVCMQQQFYCKLWLPVLSVQVVADYVIVVLLFIHKWSLWVHSSEDTGMSRTAGVLWSFQIYVC